MSVSRMKIKYEEIFQSFSHVAYGPSTKRIRMHDIVCVLICADLNRHCKTEHEGMRLQSQVEERVEQGEIVDAAIRQEQQWLPIAIDK